MTICSNLSENSRNTCNLLRCISSRLSSRTDCRGIEYEVTIFDDMSLNVVPNVLIFPNTHRRRPCDTISITQYAILSCLSPVSIYSYPDKVVLSKHCLVPGKYVFKLSADKLNRKWINMTEVTYEVKIG